MQKKSRDLQFMLKTAYIRGKIVAKGMTLRMNIGVDLVEIKKMTSVIENGRLLKKIFTDGEIEYAFSKANKEETLAGIFASKEAALKSLKKGLEGSPLRDIEVRHEDGVPTLLFHGDIEEEVAKASFKFSVSISHDGDYAVAAVAAFKS